MSQHIWTADALQSEIRPYSNQAWRLVEAQHLVSTMKLSENTTEQALLEDILDETKPPVPEECRRLDYLFSTPFRYRPYPHGSRFRRAGLTPGVWYGSEHPETAVAEMVFYRFLFYAESPDVPFPDNAAEYTAISAQLSTPVSIDLTAAPLSDYNQFWSHLTEYGACQDVADSAREAGAQVLRYTSVRDPAGRANVAVLSCAAFDQPDPIDRRTWHIRIGRTGAQALCEFPRASLDYDVNAFAADPRLRDMNWDRA